MPSGEKLDPASNAADTDSLSYEPYFGLREKPFSLSPNPRFFFRNATRTAAFEALIAALRRREGIIAVTGEVGTGKTTLCRAVLNSLDKKTFAAYVPDPILTRDDLLKTLLVDFGVISTEEVWSGRLRGASRTELAYPLYEFLTSLQPLRAFAVLIIDEAQNLPAPLLEEIRILSDMEGPGGGKLLQLLLIGQPELEQALTTPELRQLTQRLTTRIQIGPLTKEDVPGYVAYRLAVAGSGDVSFSPDALRLAFDASGGIPRVINLLCDGGLARAAAERSKTVSAANIASAAKDLRIPFPDSRVAAEAFWTPPPTPPVAKAEQPVAVEPRRVAGPLFNSQDASAGSSGRRVSARMVAVAAAAILLGAANVWLYQARRQQSASQVADAMEPPPSGLLAEAPAGTAAAVAPTTQPETASAPTLAIQMATFLSGVSADESVKELRELGYSAFQVDVSIQGGNRAYAVFLGPYQDRAAADRDYERALHIPGYVAGRIIEVAAPNLAGSR